METTETVTPEEKFLEVVKKVYLEYMIRHGFENQIEAIKMTQGKRYFKIIVGGSVHSFIDAKTSDIFFPAGWAAPAKHVRGNCLSDSNGLEALAVGGYNIRYLR